MRILATFVLAVLGSGCIDDGLAIDEAEFAGQSMQGQSMQGQSMQGQSMQGTSYGQDLAGYRYAGAKSSTGMPIYNVRVLKGELKGDIRQKVGSYKIASFTTCPDQTSGVTRNCGWKPEWVGECVPNTPVTLGASATAGLGSCSGDAMLRICSGTSGCDHGSSTFVAANDNAGLRDSCPLAKFTCPSSGRYAVMSAPHTSGTSYSVSPATKWDDAETEYYPILVSGHDWKGATLYGETWAYDAKGYPSETAHFYVADVYHPGVGSFPYGGSDPTGNTELYYIQNVDPTTGTRIDVCDATTEGAADANDWAIPVAAIWDQDPDKIGDPAYYPQSGSRVESTTLFSLACGAGVINKCYRWGYRPWESTTKRDVHQTCTRAARADYCGLGISGTKDGTLIDIWDAYGYFPEDASFEPPWESGWTTTGALCLGHYRWDNMPAPYPGVWPCPAAPVGSGVRTSPYKQCNQVTGANPDPDCAVGAPPKRLVCDTPTEANNAAASETPARTVHNYVESKIQPCDSATGDCS